MTDLEATRLCADAAGYRLANTFFFPPLYIPPLEPKEWASQGYQLYEYDHAQAMELITRLRLTVSPGFGAEDNIAIWWEVSSPYQNCVSGRKRFTHKSDLYDVDLNRAIVNCVAKMQKEKGAL
jgi:hypothetical protein